MQGDGMHEILLTLFIMIFKNASSVDIMRWID